MSYGQLVHVGESITDLQILGCELHKNVWRKAWEGLIEQGLTSHQTHYRSYRGRFLQVIWPN